MTRHGRDEPLAISPSMEPSLAQLHLPRRTLPLDRRALAICGLALVVALAAALVAQALGALIALCTHLAWYGRFSLEHVEAWANQRGAWTLVIPVLGAVVVGVMARFGSRAIRGHGIPEAMEQVLVNESRIPPRMAWLKPLSSAIAIGTGGPFGAEGPIIATGGALGSLLGQLRHTTAQERKILLASGAAAGMAATFGTPVAAVLIAVELLLFEFRARSIIPVALATSVATAVRYAFGGDGPAFPMPALAPPSGWALALYVCIGAVAGVASVGVTRLVYAIEDLFERLPIHWMWWPALGAVVVGVAGLIEPRALGVGYGNITDILAGNLPLAVLASVVLFKFVAWAIYLGSGTSGGTLAPLFTFGGGLGFALGTALAVALPAAGVDPRVAALVGMAAIFAGASRAFLTSVVFAFETTQQPMGLLPLLGGCAAAYLVSLVAMRHSIMTEKIARRGVRVPQDYAADPLDQLHVGASMTRSPVTLRAGLTAAAARAWLASGAPGTGHQGFPVVEEDGSVLGVLTQREILEVPQERAETVLRELVAGPPALVHPGHTLREAADLMTERGVGRLPVVEEGTVGPVVGIVTSSDLLAAHRRRLREQHQPAAPLRWRRAG